MSTSVNGHTDKAMSGADVKAAAPAEIENLGEVNLKRGSSDVQANTLGGRDGFRRGVRP